VSATQVKLEELGREGLLSLLQRYGTPEVTPRDLAWARHADLQAERQRRFTAYMRASRDLEERRKKDLALLERGQRVPTAQQIATAQAEDRMGRAQRAYLRASGREDAALDMLLPPVEPAADAA
jgi:hypothetical protein